MEIEEWKDIEGYEGIYQVSNYGRVKSLPRKLWNGYYFFVSKEKILKTWLSSGYPTVCLHSEDKTIKYIRVHRLVAKAFIPNPNNYRVVNHLDGGRTNNHVNNLEWCTHKHNTQCAIKTGAFDKEMRKVRIIETGEEFSSLTECARHIAKINNKKVWPEHIGSCLKGRLKSHAGYHFEEVK